MKNLTFRLSSLLTRGEDEVDSRNVKPKRLEVGRWKELVLRYYSIPSEPIQLHSVTSEGFWGFILDSRWEQFHYKSCKCKM